METVMAARKKVIWVFWPFAALWDLLAFVLNITGRVLAAVLAVALMIIGIVFTMTILGAPVGIPLAVIGLLLLIRSFF